jgi:hypothetical protein
LVDISALHSMLIEMHGGMLTLATICIIAIILDRIHLKMSGTNNKEAGFWSTASAMGKLARLTEPTAYVAGIGGVIGLIISAIVGAYVWDIELLISDYFGNLGWTKVMFSIFATELWIIFVLLRKKYGENLWKNSGMAIVYSCVGVLGFLFVVISGSLGAHLTSLAHNLDTGSVLDPIFELIGIDPLTFGVTESNFIIALIIGSIVLVIVPIVLVIYIQRQNKIIK